MISDELVNDWFEDDYPSAVNMDQVIEEADIYSELIDLAIAYKGPIGVKLWKAAKKLLNGEFEAKERDRIEDMAE